MSNFILNEKKGEGTYITINRADVNGIVSDDMATEIAGMIDELEHCHFSSVTPAAVRHLQHAGVSPAASLVALRKDVKELLHDGRITGPVKRQAAGGIVALLGKSDQAIHDAPNFLCLLNRRHHLLLQDHRIRHIPKHGQTMGCVSAKFATVN